MSQTIDTSTTTAVLREYSKSSHAVCSLGLVQRIFRVGHTKSKRDVIVKYCLQHYNVAVLGFLRAALPVLTTTNKTAGKNIPNQRNLSISVVGGLG